jgi:hypothetical protein
MARVRNANAKNHPTQNQRKRRLLDMVMTLYLKIHASWVVGGLLCRAEYVSMIVLAGSNANVTMCGGRLLVC